MKKISIKPGRGMWSGLVIMAVIAMAATWTMAKMDKSFLPTANARALADGDLSMALLEVNNMSCGGCVDTITKSLAPLTGVAEISVDVAAGTTQVTFNPAVLEDHQQIARVITEAGYPAKISRIYTAQEVRQEALRSAERAKIHIATVGQVDIPREDYAFELRHARKQYEQIYGQDVFDTERGGQLLQRIKSQIALRLIDEGVKLQEVARAGYTVSKGAIDQALGAYLKDKNTTLDQFKADLAANDYPFPYFQTKFSRKIRLQQYLENKVLAGSVDDDARQQQYGNWLANARTLAKVTYYDKELEKMVKAGSGSSCSGSGGGSCANSQ